MNKGMRFLFSVLLFSFLLNGVPSIALTLNPQISSDSSNPYSRGFFKHWIDSDKDGCDTRKEVLIAEAIVKPKVSKKCAISGGLWRSTYDGFTVRDASKLDVDHIVPLKEAWRSGAWAWTPKQRQDFANDLEDSRALIAVSINSNRSKSDNDISDWVPATDPCGYVKDWVAIKARYSLTYDSREAETLGNFYKKCNFGDIKVSVIPGLKYQSFETTTVYPKESPSPISSPAPNPIASATPVIVKFKMPMIQFEGRLGTVISKWKSYGFLKQPKIEQEPSALKEYACKPISENDFIYNVSPKWDSEVDENTQVTIIVGCNVDYESKKSTPIPQSTSSTFPSPSDSSTPLSSTSATPTPNPSPTPTSTPVLQGPIITPGAFCTPPGAVGYNSSGTKYECKSSLTDSRNRWRQ
jgi:hypothetical protein